MISNSTGSGMGVLALATILFAGLVFYFARRKR